MFYFNHNQIRFGIQILAHLIKSKPKVKNQAGFTLIEMLAVIVIIAILSAIAAPSWLAFVSRQRVNKANDAILAALLDAQKEAKKYKRDYSVSFKQNSNNVPVFAIHPGNTPPPDSSASWRSLSNEIELKPGQLFIYSNLDITNTSTSGTANNTPATRKYNKKDTARTNYLAAPIPSSGASTITFDYMGTLPNVDLGETDTTRQALGLKMAVATPRSNTNTSAGNLKRCVIINTLIGGMRTGQDDECN
jgi:prepilin-type N-terminal cleavage/methylation domain-containing protein